MKSGVTGEGETDYKLNVTSNWFSRDYFGVKLGFYFAWLGYYTVMLIPPSLVGTIMQNKNKFAENCPQDEVFSKKAKQHQGNKGKKKLKL